MATWAFGSGGHTMTRTLEDTVLETTGNPKNANLRDAADKASFVHRATDENSHGDYTYIADPSINGDANAIVLVTPRTDRGTPGMVLTITTSVFGTKA